MAKSLYHEYERLLSNGSWKYYPLKETYRDYQNRGGNIGGITELDKVCYWCPESFDTTEQALQVIFEIMRGKKNE